MPYSTDEISILRNTFARIVDVVVDIHMTQHQVNKPLDMIELSIKRIETKEEITTYDRILLEAFYRDRRIIKLLNSVYDILSR